MYDGGNILEERKTLNNKKLMDAKLSAAQLMELENKHGAHNYHPVPVVLDKGGRCVCMGCGRKEIL